MLFVFYCEDMGRVLAFPPKLLQQFLSARSADPYYDPDATTIWADMTRLFHAMNAGTTFGRETIHRFNGGLFAADPTLDALHVPNRLFCQPNQAQNEATIASSPRTVLFLCATYNYAAALGEGSEREALGLYTLGHIFEQSITELEMLEAQAEGRESVNRLSGRKTDGVYYTPEWVVERLVDGTIGPRLWNAERGRVARRRTARRGGGGLSQRAAPFHGAGPCMRLRRFPDYLAPLLRVGVAGHRTASRRGGAVRANARFPRNRDPRRGHQSILR